MDHTKLLRVGVQLAAVTCVLVGADIALTPLLARAQLERLATVAPDTTSYMRRAAERRHPPRRRVWMPLSQMSPVAVCAVVFSEESAFFQNGAFDVNGQRAFRYSVLHGDFSRGYSGINQQLARNLFLSPDRTPIRKAKEYLLALALHQRLSKERVLELYLNLVEWEDGVWGIEAASQDYFNVSASQLTPAQAAILASALPAPKRGTTFLLGPSASQRQEGLAKRLWSARLLSTADYGETVDRLREWRAAMRSSPSAQLAWAHTDSLMGPSPDTPPPMAQQAGAVPIAQLCNTRRRN